MWLAIGYKYSYFEGQGDLVSRLIMGIAGVTKWLIGLVSLLTPMTFQVQIGSHYRGHMT